MPRGAAARVEAWRRQLGDWPAGATPAGGPPEPPFPSSPLDVVVELFVDQSWIDVTPQTLHRDGITITRGRANETSRVEASECHLTLNNADGTFSPRNPMSWLFGKIGRNTPIRVKVGADVRFTGEVATWPQRWDHTGTDVYVPITAAGVLRRLGQGAAAAPSVQRAYLAASGPAAYWPLEDGPQTTAGIAVAGKHPHRLLAADQRTPLYTAPHAWGQGDLAPWLPKGLKLEGAATSASTRATVEMTGAGDLWTFDVMRSGGVPGLTFHTAIWQDAVTPTAIHSLDLITDGDIFTVELLYDLVQIDIATLPKAALWDDNPHHVRLRGEQAGANILFSCWLDGVLVLSATQASATLQGVKLCHLIGTSHDTIPLTFGHCAFWVGNGPTLTTTVGVARGRTGEAAGRRIQRLCAEHGIPFTSIGNLDQTAGMGAQGVRPVLELLQECADADGGILYEPRGTLGLAYRTRGSLYNQTPALALDYSAQLFAAPPEPVDDDQSTRNDVTAKRPDSGEARAVLTSGPLSVQTPPAGVGTYDTEITLNVAGDGFLPDQASWRLHLGTVDEARYPQLALHLHDRALIDSGVAAGAAALDLGDLVALTDLPPWLPPDDVALLVQGSVETLRSFTRDLQVNCAPGSPYQIARYEAGAGATVNKYDTAGSELLIGIDATDTAFDVASTLFPTTSVDQWTAVDAEDGFDIYVGGERMSVTDIAATFFNAQTFTVTRSVNGVVKAHAAGTPIRLWTTPKYGL